MMKCFVCPYFPLKKKNTKIKKITEIFMEKYLLRNTPFKNKIESLKVNIIASYFLYNLTLEKYCFQIKYNCSWFEKPILTSGKHAFITAVYRGIHYFSYFCSKI